MEAGEIIIKIKTVADDFKENLDEVVKKAKDRAKEAGGAFSTVFSKISLKLKTSLVSVFSKITTISSRFARIMIDVIGSVTKLGIGFGAIGIVLGIIIAGAFAIAKAFEKVTNENQQLKMEIQYIAFALKTTLEPVIEAIASFLVKIINFLIKAIEYLFAFIKLLTGKNIFEKATPQAFADSLKEANKNATALRKTLAGFDEMNILNENGSVGVLGGLGGFGNIEDQIANMRDFKKEIEDIANKIKRWFLGGDTLSEGLENAKKSIRNTINTIKQLFEPVGNWFEEQIFTPLGEKWKSFIEATKPIWQPIEDEFNKIVEQMKKDWEPFVQYLEPNVIKPMKDKFNDFKNRFLQRFAPFINQIIYWINRTFGIFGVNLDYIQFESEQTGDGIEENIVGALDDTQEKANTLSSKDYNINIIQTSLKDSKNWLDDIWENLKSLTSKTWQIVTSFVSNGFSRSTTNSWLDPIRNTLSKIGIKLPFLAKGAIINMPGRGVPVGNAIAGERGHEAVLPLTDSQQMALLGEAIGKYININATVPVYVGNRQIAREIRKIEAENDFAYNG